MPHFDLNIDTILEAWTLADALREVIANALDEQILTGTDDIVIEQVAEAVWRVRDYGRGLRVGHLTQNENDEKLSAVGIIGKFGVGLKDALATFDRHGVAVTITSSHGVFTPVRAGKHGFEDLITLHVDVAPAPDGFVGTEFVFQGLKEEVVEQAKAYFLRFSGERLLETTAYGEVLARGDEHARIYINGVRVAEEENMLFSYNVTSLNAAMRRALNRERTHVGRSAYAERLKAMLLACKSYPVATRLVDDLERYASGGIHDELRWIDVQEHACVLLNENGRVVFVTARELENTPDSAYRAKEDGYRMVVIPDALRHKIQGKADASGQALRTVAVFECEFNDSFVFDYVNEQDMTAEELRVWKLREPVLALVKCPHVREVRVSNTMRLEKGFEVAGLWSPAQGRITLRRDRLQSEQDFLGTLLHELTHARSGAADMTREFESELSCLLGLVASEWLTIGMGA